MKKLEKNLKYIQESKRITSASQFCQFQQLMEIIAVGLRTNFAFKTMSFMGILEDQQKKFLSDFHDTKQFQLKSLINEEKWGQVKV